MMILKILKGIAYAVLGIVAMIFLLGFLIGGLVSGFLFS